MKVTETFTKSAGGAFVHIDATRGYEDENGALILSTLAANLRANGFDDLNLYEDYPSCKATVAFGTDPAQQNRRITVMLKRS